MRMTPNRSEADPVLSKPAYAKPPEIASASVRDTLAAPHMNCQTGLTYTGVNTQDAAIRAIAVIGPLRELRAVGRR